MKGMLYALSPAMVAKASGKNHEEIAKALT
jgi:hypothetical protein